MKKMVFAALISLIVLSCVHDQVNTPTINLTDSRYKYAQTTDIVINEICASNSGAIQDESNNDPDWIELYNKVDSSINLNSYGLSDDSNDIFKWRFGNTVIKPHQYLLVFASGKNVFDVKQLTGDDTISFSAAYPWSDSAVGGGSTIRPNEYPNILSIDALTKKPVISASITIIDNRDSLDWSSANIVVGMDRQKADKVYDYSMYNYLEFIMTLDKDKPLCIRLLQGDKIVNWRAPKFVLKGTGVKNDTYRIPLVQGNNGFDLTYITSLSFEALEYTFTTVNFTVKSIRFFHTGYNLHTNYQLSGNDRRLYLCQPDSTILDTAQIATVPDNMSMGKVNNKWAILKRPTPGLENVQEYYSGISQIPVSVKKGGFYDGPVNVMLQSTDNGDIFYTTDGSAPTNVSRKYTGPIQIDSTTVIRFISFKEGLLSSDIQTETFFINVKTKLPVVSLITDPGALFDPDTGIYESGPNAASAYPYFGSNFWKDKEVPIHIQFYESDKTIRFSKDAGISIMGNWSRANPKKSLGIKFREEYGQSELDYPLFPQYPKIHKFKKIVLRNNGGNYGGAMIEDPMMQSLLDDRGMDYQKYRPAVVFINGKYYGLHQLVEAANTDYVYSNYDLKEDQIDFYDVGSIKQGTTDHWNMLNNYLLSRVKTDGAMTAILQDSSYTRVKQYMDVYNFIDYMAFEIYINNTDWPANNNRWWRNISNGRWRWIVYDVDYGFGNGYPVEKEGVDYNTLAFALDNTTGSDDYPNGLTWTFTLRALLQNQSFKEDFINRLATLVATNFEPERVKLRIDQMSNEIKDEIDIDYPRWNLPVSNFSTSVQGLKDFAEQRPALMYQFIQKQFGIVNTFSLTVKSSNGIVTINDMSVYSSVLKGKYFTGIPVRLTAIPLKGKQFKKWSDGNSDNPRIINSEKDIELEALCE